jgi:predicted dehydrogenase
MTGPLHIAVVGLGGIAQSVHLPLIARRWDLFTLVAVADLSPARTATIGARYGLPLRNQYRTVEEVLSAVADGLTLDGVILATSGSHGADLRALTAAGLPVLCEKPVAVSTAEIDSIEREDCREGRGPEPRVLVGYMKEYDPATTRAREELADKQLRAVTVEVLHPADASQLHFARLLSPPTDVDRDVLAALERDTQLRVDQAIGTELSTSMRAVYTNVVLGSMVHDISLLRRLAGGISSIDSAVRWGEDMPGSVQLTGTVASGARLHMGWHFLPDYPDYRETLTFHHEHGSVQLVFSVPYLLNVATELVVISKALAGDAGAGEARTVLRWPQQEAFENELVAFHDMVAKGTTPISSVLEGRADVQTGQRIVAALARHHGEDLGGEAAQLVNRHRHGGRSSAPAG